MSGPTDGPDPWTLVPSMVRPGQSLTRFRGWKLGNLNYGLGPRSVVPPTVQVAGATDVSQLRIISRLTPVSQLRRWAYQLSFFNHEQRSTSTDRQSTDCQSISSVYGSISSVDGSVNFQSSVANDGRPVLTISRLTARQSAPSMGESTFSPQSPMTVDLYEPSVDSRPVS
uniref:Uncharacterized protein n=1 Tax=Solanum tuberosum TaxID=4113 RepID=M1DV47_SOLTU